MKGIRDVSRRATSEKLSAAKSCCQEPQPTRMSRKEVIQPQVPLRLPCYDLVPVTEPSVGTAVMRPLRLFPAPMT